MKHFTFGTQLIGLVFAAAQAMAGGLTVNNSAGYAESNLEYAFKNFVSVLRLAESSPAFHDDTSRAMIARLRTIAITETSQPENLKIQNEPPPGLTDWNGRDFVTTYRALDPIYVRLDSLYPRAADGNVRPLTYPEATGLVVRLLGARESSYPESAWTTLGQKLSKFALFKSEFLYFGVFGQPDYRVPTVTALVDPTSQVSWGLLVTDAEKVHDLLPVLLSFVKTQLPDVEAVRFTGLRWIIRSNTLSIEGMLATKGPGGSWSPTARILQFTFPLKNLTNSKEVKIFEPSTVAFSLVAP